MLGIQTVAILGTGRDAIRLALACSLAGMEVRVRGESTGAMDAAFHDLRREVERALADGIIGREERQRILDGILFTPELEEALVGADLVFAAGPADPATAAGLLSRAARSCRATTLLATPHPPDATAVGVPQPGRVVRLAVDGAGVLPSVSLDPGSATTPHALERGDQLAARLRRAQGERG